MKKRKRLNKYKHIKSKIQTSPGKKFLKQQLRATKSKVKNYERLLPRHNHIISEMKNTINIILRQNNQLRLASETSSGIALEEQDTFCD